MSGTFIKLLHLSHRQHFLKLVIVALLHVQPFLLMPKNEPLCSRLYLLLPTVPPDLPFSFLGTRHSCQLLHIVLVKGNKFCRCFVVQHQFPGHPLGPSVRDLSACAACFRPLGLTMLLPASKAKHTAIINFLIVVSFLIKPFIFCFTEV